MSPDLFGTDMEGFVDIVVVLDQPVSSLGGSEVTDDGEEPDVAFDFLRITLMLEIGSISEVFEGICVAPIDSLELINRLLSSQVVEDLHEAANPSILKFSGKPNILCLENVVEALESSAIVHWKGKMRV